MSETPDTLRDAWKAGEELGKEHARLVDEPSMSYSNLDVREQFLRGYRRAGRLNAQSPVHSPSPSNGWKGGGHYSINWIAPEHAWEWLRQKFPDGKASELCWIVLSTSGVHGTYATLDDVLEETFVEVGGHPEVTFVCTEPRLVRTCYGNVPVTSQKEVDWLRGLVSSSLGQIRKTQTENLPKCPLWDTTTGERVKCNEPAGHMGPHLDKDGARTDGKSL